MQSKDTTNDTTANGMDYAGYSPVTTYPGSRLVIMTKEYGSSQSIEVKCSNKKLAQALGIDSAADDDGFIVQGSDVKAEFTTDPMARESDLMTVPYFNKWYKNYSKGC